MYHDLLGIYRPRRRLTPAQMAEVRKAKLAGARASDLAVAYGVHVRAIYRAVHRATEPAWTVRVADFLATFVLEDGRPVQVTPWLPA